jgi:flagellar basal body rod protein FlgG
VIWATEPPDTTDPNAGINRTNIGNIQLHTFAPDCEFVRCGDNVFVVTRNGRYPGALIGAPGMSRRGVLRQGCLEESNVDRQQEFENLQKLEQQARVLEEAAPLLRFTQSPDGNRTMPLVK